MIGVFDSGVGGLAILDEIHKLLPRSDLFYVADRGRAPYGNQSLVEVERMSLEVGTWLIDRGAATLVVACNTASAAALESLREEFPGIPIVGMEPAVKPAASTTSSGVVGVFATAATFQGELFETVMANHAPETTVITRACPEWVELVESGTVTGSQARAVVGPVVESVIMGGADKLVLGCTHFSFLRPVIEEAAANRASVIDPAPAVAAQTARVTADTGGTGSITFAASGDRARFAELLTTLTGFGKPKTVLPFPS